VDVGVARPGEAAFLGDRGTPGGEQNALMIAPMPFAVPTVTCTITTWGRPVTR
jgi:hypothetical protein